MYQEKTNPPLTVSPPVGKVDNESLVMREKTTLSKMFPMIWLFFSHQKLIYPPTHPYPPEINGTRPMYTSLDLSIWAVFGCAL